MTIEIVNTEIKTVAEKSFRVATIIISSGSETYLYLVGGLPLTGNLQTILDAREAELFTAAQAKGKPVDLYEIVTRRVLKAFVLVVLDEVNILRQQAGLAPRTAGQIDNALKAKIKGL